MSTPVERRRAVIVLLEVVEREFEDHGEFVDECRLERASPSCAMPISGWASL